MGGTDHIHTYHIPPPHFKPSRDTQNEAKMGISKSTMGAALKWAVQHGKYKIARSGQGFEHPNATLTQKYTN